MQCKTAVLTEHLRHFRNQRIDRDAHLGGQMTCTRPYDVDVGGDRLIRPITSDRRSLRNSRQIIQHDSHASPAPETAASVMARGSRVMREELNRLISSTKLRPLVDRVFSFDDVPQAYA